MHVQIESARAQVKGAFTRSGSVLAGTAMGRVERVDVELSITSPSGPAKVAELVRLAERMCYVNRALRDPVAGTVVVFLNGEQLAVL